MWRGPRLKFKCGDSVKVMFSIFNLAAIPEIMVASPEPMSILFWGITLVLLSVKLRSRKSASQQLIVTTESVERPLGQPFVARIS